MLPRCTPDKAHRRCAALVTAPATPPPHAPPGACVSAGAGSGSGLQTARVICLRVHAPFPVACFEALAQEHVCGFTLIYYAFLGPVWAATPSMAALTTAGSHAYRALSGG